MIRLPGLIDAHVHLRDPGQTDREDLGTGTSAALAGGFTIVLDMPNNSTPVTSPELLGEKLDIARQKALCDIGFYYGSLGDNLDTFDQASQHAIALKLYLNITTGGYILDLDKLAEIYAAWPADKPIVLHTEESTIDLAINSLDTVDRPIHVAHMPSEEILTKIMRAKDAGRQVTCGVTPHHLFLTDEDVDRLGNSAMMKPSLKSMRDRKFLWDHLSDIDIIESDHAPHTLEQKKAGAFGIPGLETTLPLLLQAEREGRLDRSELTRLCHDRPAEIFHIETDDQTYIEIDEVEYQIEPSIFKSKAKWSPFAGRAVFGKVDKVVNHGQIVLEHGQILTQSARSARMIIG